MELALGGPTLTSLIRVQHILLILLTLTRLIFETVAQVYVINNLEQLVLKFIMSKGLGVSLVAEVY